VAKQASIEERLTELAKLSKQPDTGETRIQVRKHLASKVSLIAARAADIIAHIENRELIPDLVAAFHRFMHGPAKTDKGCAAKIAIVKALLAADYDDDEIYRIGIRHVQLEPTWGGSSDTAAELRALCGLGLVQVGSADVMEQLSELLADKVADARIGAARALAHCGATATPLLRFKVLTGDEEPAVIAECFSGLMTSSPRASFEFVAKFVEPNCVELYEHAALALAESRLPEVFEFLREKWTSTFDREFKQSLLLPMALTRCEAARDFLLSVLESGEVRLATGAIAGLTIYRDDPTVRARAEAAIDGPKRAELLAALRRAFE
jgi:HEAT repeat protein